MSLYDIDTEMQELLQIIEESEGEVGPELYDRIEFIKGEATEKLSGLARWATNLKADAEAAKIEAKRLQELSAARRRKYESIKNYLQYAVETFSGGKFKDSAFSLSVGNAGGAKSLVIDGDVPEAYKVQEWSIDKECIKAALLEGTNLRFAHFAERKKVLRGV